MIYSSQILLFDAEFTQVYATHAGRKVKPEPTCSTESKPKEGENGQRLTD